MKVCKECHQKPIYCKDLCKACYARDYRRRKTRTVFSQPNYLCDNCKKPVYIEPSRQERNRFSYCSRQCLSEHRKKYGLQTGDKNPAYKGGLVELQCIICGKKFERQRAQYIESQERYYCSQECQHKGLSLFFSGPNSPHIGNWETRPCDFCGQELSRPSWQFRALAFCNRQCFAHWKSENWSGKDNPVWRGGHEPYYGPNWKCQSRRARARDRHICQRCGVTEKEFDRALDVHHIIRFGDFNRNWKQANRLDNLTSYCHSCHMLIEHFKS